jgi:hypothetical protein
MAACIFQIRMVSDPMAAQATEPADGFLGALFRGESPSTSRAKSSKAGFLGGR